MRWNKNGINGVLLLFIVEFDFIFIFFNDDDCDWTQRNDKYAPYVSGHFQHDQRVESVEYGAHRYCVPGFLYIWITSYHFISTMMHFTLSLRLFLSCLHIQQYFDPTHMWYTSMLISIFSNLRLFKADFIFLIFFKYNFASVSLSLSLPLPKFDSSKFLVGKFMGNSSLLLL